MAITAQDRIRIESELRRLSETSWTCRSCGCWDLQACITEEGPCRWVEPDLCSACVDPAGEPLAEEAPAG